MSRITIGILKQIGYILAIILEVTLISTTETAGMLAVLYLLLFFTIIAFLFSNIH